MFIPTIRAEAFLYTATAASFARHSSHGNPIKFLCPLCGKAATVWEISSGHGIACCPNCNIAVTK